MSTSDVEAARSSPAAGVRAEAPAHDDLLPEARNAGFRKRVCRAKKGCASWFSRRSLIAGFSVTGVLLALFFLFCAFGSGHRQAVQLDAPASGRLGAVATLAPADFSANADESAATVPGFANDFVSELARTEQPAFSTVETAPITNSETDAVRTRSAALSMSRRVRRIPLAVASHPPSRVSVYDHLAGLV